jgi:hypothetical protein
MCLITRNCFSCTKTDPIHLLLDHTYISSPCENNKYTPAYLNRHCVQPVVYEKKFEYSCELCLTQAGAERKTKAKEKYFEDVKHLQEILDKLKKELRQAGQIVSPSCRTRPLTFIRICLTSLRSGERKRQASWSQAITESYSNISVVISAVE